MDETVTNLPNFSKDSFEDLKIMIFVLIDRYCDRNVSIPSDLIYSSYFS